MLKNIKWANRELPGLSDEVLSNLTTWKMAQSENGKLTYLENLQPHDSNLQSKRGKRGGPKGGKTQGDINATNGHLEKSRKIAIQNRKRRANEGYQKTLDQLPNEFTGIDVQRITPLPYPTIKYGILNGKIIKLKRNLYRKV